jgi:hypothetical protein
VSKVAGVDNLSK